MYNHNNYNLNSRDQRAALEYSIATVLEVASSCLGTGDSDYTSDSESNPVVEASDELTLTVRKDLTPALRDLIQHGLMPVSIFYYNTCSLSFNLHKTSFQLNKYL